MSTKKKMDGDADETAGGAAATPADPPPATHADTPPAPAATSAAAADAGAPAAPVGPPTHWRVTRKGAAAGIGWRAGTIIRDMDVAPQAGAMHVRGLIVPATPEQIERATRGLDEAGEVDGEADAE